MLRTCHESPSFMSPSDSLKWVLLLTTREAQMYSASLWLLIESAARTQTQVCSAPKPLPFLWTIPSLQPQWQPQPSNTNAKSSQPGWGLFRRGCHSTGGHAFNHVPPISSSEKWKKTVPGVRTVLRPLLCNGKASWQYGEEQLPSSNEGKDSSQNTEINHLLHKN